MSRRSSLVKTLSAAFLGGEEKKEDDDADGEPTFLASDLGLQVAAILDKYGDKIHDDSFLKIIRQLEFWYTTDDLSNDEFLALTERLAKIASWRDEVDDESIPDDKKFKIPTVRFGKTEIDMPIVTCGGELCCNVICVHILYMYHISVHILLCVHMIVCVHYLMHIICVQLYIS